MQIIFTTSLNILNYVIGCPFLNFIYVQSRYIISAQYTFSILFTAFYTFIFDTVCILIYNYNQLLFPTIFSTGNNYETLHMDVFYFNRKVPRCSAVISRTTECILVLKNGLMFYGCVKYYNRPTDHIEIFIIVAACVILFINWDKCVVSMLKRLTMNSCPFNSCRNIMYVQQYRHFEKKKVKANGKCKRQEENDRMVIENQHTSFRIVTLLCIFTCQASPCHQ